MVLPEWDPNRIRKKIPFVLGLTGDGLRDLACWVLLGLAPLVIMAALLRHRTQPSN